MEDFVWEDVDEPLLSLLEGIDEYKEYRMMDCGSDDDMCFYNCVCKGLEFHEKYGSLFPVFLKEMVDDEIKGCDFYSGFKEEGETGVGHLEIMVCSKILNCIFVVYRESDDGIDVDKIWDKENIEKPEFLVELYLESSSSHFYLLGKGDKKKVRGKVKMESYFSLLI